MRALAILLFLTCLFWPVGRAFADESVPGTRSPMKPNEKPISELIARIDDANIRFVTFSPDRHAMPLLRRVAVDGPPEAVALISRAQLEVLDQLVETLRDKKRAWASHVILSAMTNGDAWLVQPYSTNPRRWYRTFGKSAFNYWKHWLDEHRRHLTWNAEQQAFVSNEE